MNYVEALNEIADYGQPSLFLGGGITNCPDWQKEVVQMLAESDVTLLNPRRANFPIHDPSASQKQIEWEHKMLRHANGILFWFPCETLCPIVLYELGGWSMTDKPLFVGVHPSYQRSQDVLIQTRLVRPDVKVHFSLSEVVVLIKEWLEQGVNP